MDKQSVIMKRGEGETLSVLGTTVRFLCESGKTDNGFSVMEVVLPKDQGPPPHDHPWDEAYYILEGQARFQVGELQAVFGPGDFLYAPGGVVHAFQGASEAPARVLVMDAPAAAEKFFREVDREVRAMPQDLAKLPQIGSRHRLTFRPAA